MVTCALHQWTYDVTTGEYQGNPDVHVGCFEVRVEGDDVFVCPTPRVPPTPPFEPRDLA
jgi:nitrite reductase/ring-hydroxylating ferredoxin subunit